MTVTSGRAEKGDILIELEKRETGVIGIDLTSSVQTLFGEQIKATIQNTLQKLGIQHVHVKANDRGALDHVIMARVEDAARELLPIEGPGVLPPAKGPQPQVTRDRLRRSRLYIPGNNPDLMLNAGLFGADAIILDLEDSVAPADKPDARILVRNSLRAVDFGSSERMVRINSFRTPFGADDLEQIIPAGPDTILIPKCEGKEDVQAVEERIASIEKRFDQKKETFLMPIIESAKGVLLAFEIASASPRVVAICFGAEDFTADIGTDRTKEGRESYLARCQLVLAARAAGVQAIDTVFSDVADTEGLIASTKEAISLGFDGKGLIHPGQIEPVHRAFAPTPKQIEHAQKVLAALREAEEKGSGVASLGRKMIDAPVAARARRTLELAKRMGLLESE
ncbi:citrate lyase acyl carrier protein [candidate division KSB1 bacterium]|nr:citrate lyase acyl carrier protein [candidate division KSB1 bacterium]